MLFSKPYLIPSFRRCVTNLRTYFTYQPCARFVNYPINSYRKYFPTHFKASTNGACRYFHVSSLRFEFPEPISDLNSKANMGECIITLQNELEEYCETGLKDFSIYAKELQFYDPYTKLHLSSLSQYKWASRLLRILLNTHFISPQIILISLRQKKPEPTSEPPSSTPQDLFKDHHIIAQFVFSGVPRLRWYWSRLIHPYSSVDDYVSEFECVCVYDFNSHGRVKSHWIDRIRPQPNVWRIIHWAPWLTKRFSSGTQHPRPGLGLELIENSKRRKH